MATAVSAGWKLPPTTALYQPVGYGSHHWLIESAAGERWFASVDHLAERDRQGSFDRLEAALSAAVVARQSGLSFIVAPVPTPDGAVLHRLRDMYALALYPYVVGRSGEFTDQLPAVEADELTGMLCSLHSVPIATAATSEGGVAVDASRVPGWEHVDGALAELPDPDGWPDPYGDPLRQLLIARADDVESASLRHRELVTAAGSQCHRLVLTHGEPHPGNLIHTRNGLALIDWDTATLAPPERDVWLLDVRTEGQAAQEYTARSGRPLDLRLLSGYKLAWSGRPRSLRRTAEANP